MKHSALDEFIEATVATDIQGTVANVQPRVNMSYRLAVIGEAPDADAVREQRPFVGMSGRFLTSLLSKAGIIRDACFIGNICQHRPLANDISRFPRDGSEIQGGLEKLAEDLRTAQPNACLLLGKTALWAALGTDNISDWRGSWFIGKQGPFNGRKCLASYHPAACLRQYEWTPLLMFDIKKAKDGAGCRDLVVPQRDLRVNLTYEQLVDEMEKVIRERPFIGIDIEGGNKSMSCISIAVTPLYSFIVPFTKMSGLSYWGNEDQEVRIWQLLVQILGDPKIEKVVQYSLYDAFVFLHSLGVVVRGITNDTLLKHWELYCEMEKNLGFLCSLYCGNEAYYKQDRHSDDQDTYFTYCCKDSANTLEISQKLETMLCEESMKHYKFNVALINPLLYMQERGIRYDSDLAKKRREEVLDLIYVTQYKLDCEAKCGLDYTKTKVELLSIVRDIMCYKRDRERPTSGFADVFPKAESLLLTVTPLTDGDKGFLNTACKLHMNTKSKRLKEFFFVTKGFPEQWNKEQTALSTDFEALLRLKKKSNDVVLDYAISLALHRTRAQMLSILPGEDGRMHCSYNHVGSETGRISSSRSTIYIGNKRVGTNMQTVSDSWELDDEELVLMTEGLRNLYQADPGCYLFQCDLKGSDGWTVGAHMAALGDRTMLDDLLGGLKPAQTVAYILRHPTTPLTDIPRDQLKVMLKEVKKEDQDYYICKQLIWGKCYLMGPRKASDQVFKETYGKIHMGEERAREFQAAVTKRYNVSLWHTACTNLIAKQSYPPKLKSAGGQIRRFFGRQREILGEWLAHEPQANTTYATNLALYRLWNDPDNRLATVTNDAERKSALNSNGIHSTLRIEPLHQVHDALLGQFKIEDTEWAIGKIKSYFANTLMIAGIPIVIPFEGNYGTDWALDEESKKGTI